MSGHSDFPIMSRDTAVSVILRVPLDPGLQSSSSSLKVLSSQAGLKSQRSPSPSHVFVF